MWLSRQRLPAVHNLKAQVSRAVISIWTHSTLTTVIKTNKHRSPTYRQTRKHSSQLTRWKRMPWQVKTPR